MDRRKFIRTGSLALAGTVTVPTLASALPGTKGEAATLVVPPTGSKGGVAAAMEHFGVTTPISENDDRAPRRGATTPTSSSSTPSATACRCKMAR